MITGKTKAKGVPDQKWVLLELPITPGQVIGLVLLAGMGLTMLIVLGVILAVVISPERFEQLLARRY